MNKFSLNQSVRLSAVSHRSVPASQCGGQRECVDLVSAQLTAVLVLTLAHVLQAHDALLGFTQEPGRVLSILHQTWRMKTRVHI